MSELLEFQSFSTDRIEFAGIVFIVEFFSSAFSFLSSCHSVILKAQNLGILEEFQYILKPPKSAGGLRRSC